MAADQPNPKPNPNVRQFSHELDLLVQRARLENELSYAEMVGVLAIKQQCLVLEMVHRQPPTQPTNEMDAG